MSTVSKLQIVLEATTTAFDRGLRKAQDGLNAFAKQTDKIHAKMESFQKRHQGAFDAMQAIGAASAVGLVAIGAGIKATTAEAMKFESAMAEVKKVVNFESPDGIKQMRAELEELSTRVPIAFDGLAKIAAAAGQSGIAANEISRFTEAAAMMGTAFDITAEEAGQAMAEMRTAFKMSQDEVETLADKINYLGNTSPNSAAKIMQITQAVGAVAELGGFAADQTAALASVIVGIDPSNVATGLKNISLQLTAGTSATKSQRAAFEALGLSAEEVAKKMKEDAVGTLLEITQLVGEKIPEYEQSAVSSMLVGREALPVFAQLVQNQDLAREKVEAMGDAIKYAGSMSQEAANINNTSAAKMEMFKNATQNAKAAIGDAFLPALGALAEALLPVINGIKQFAQENPTMVTAITGIVGGVLVLGTALGAIGLAVPLVTTALGGLTAIAGLVGTAIGAISLPVVAVVAAIAALVAAGVWLYNNWDMVKAKAIEVWNAIPQYASQAWQWIQGVWSGVGAWFGGIWDGIKESASVAWEWIKGIVSGAWENLKSSFTGGGDLLSETWEAIKAGVGEAWDGIKQAVIDKFNEIKQAFLEWVGGQPVPVQEMVTNIISIFTGLVGGIGAVWGFISSGASVAWEGIKGIAGGAIDWISTKWDGIKSGASNAWESVKSTVSGAFESVKGYASEKLGQAKTTVSNIASDIGSAWDKAKDGAGKAFDNVKSTIGEKLGGAKSEADKVMEGVKSAIASSGVGEAFSKGFDSAKNAVSTAMSGIKSAVTVGITAVKAMIQLHVTGFAIIFNAGFNAVKTVVSTVFNAIKALVRGDINGVKTAIQSGLSQLGGIARNAMSQMVSAVTSIGGRLRQAGSEIVQGLINGISSKIEGAVAKVREMASRMKNAVTGFFDINSPSRVMKQIGEWVSEGLAIGIAYKAPMAADEAKKMAENTKKAVESEMESTARSIFLMQQKIRNNPFAELTTDIAFGKYEGQDATKLLALKEEERRQANILSLTDEARKLGQDIAKVGLNRLDILEFEYQKTDKFHGISREVFDAYKAQVAELERRNQLLADGITLENKQKELAKRVHLFGNADPLAELKYELDQLNIDPLMKAKFINDSQNQLTRENFATLNKEVMTQQEDPIAKIQREYDEKIAIITAEEQRIGEITAATLAARHQAQDNFVKQSLDLEIKAFEKKTSLWTQRINLASGVWDKMTEIVKNAYGEQSAAAKIMFSGQKIIAMAQALINTELAATKALAEGGAIAGIPMAKMVRATGYASVGLIASQAIGGLTGQAHDGIMSVPKSGTWNLEKGERVLPQHTAKALDDKLDGMGSGGTVNNINVNVSVDSTGGDVTSGHNFGKRLGDAIRTAIQQELMREKRQGGMLYGI